MSRWLAASLVVLLAASLSMHAYTPDNIALKVQGPDTQGNPLFTAQQPPSFNLTINQGLAASANNAAASNNVTLAASAGLTTYCSGFQVTGAGATAGSVLDIQLQGTISTPMHYQLVIPAGAGVSVQPLIVTFNPPIPANATNQQIVLAVPSFGAGNTNASASIQGFRQ